MHASIIYNFNVPAQFAFARAISQEVDKPYLDTGMTFTEYHRHTYKSALDAIADAFEQSSLPVYPCISEGSFSMTLDISECRDLVPDKYYHDDYTEGIHIRSYGDEKCPFDYAFCRWLTVEKGVALLPCSFCVCEEANE